MCVCEFYYYLYIYCGVVRCFLVRVSGYLGENIITKTCTQGAIDVFFTMVMVFERGKEVGRKMKKRGISPIYTR